MTLFEVVIKVTHDCPLCNISKKFQTLKMFSWCNRENDVVEIIVTEPEEHAAVIKEASKIKGIIEVSSDRQNIYFITSKCFCLSENSVIRRIDEFNLLQVPPIIYDKGWEYYRLIAFKHEDLKRLMERLEKEGFVFDVARKTPFDGSISSSLTLTADALFSDLTSKQVEALLTAYSNGYYRLPRNANIKTIACKKRIPRTTFQEHLKKAENKIMTSLIPYVQLHKHASPEKRELLKTKMPPNI